MNHKKKYLCFNAEKRYDRTLHCVGKMNDKNPRYYFLICDLLLTYTPLRYNTNRISYF